LTPLQYRGATDRPARRSNNATFYIPADAIAVTPNAMHDSLEKSSYVISIDREFV
jgi:hypothetical protein